MHDILVFATGAAFGAASVTTALAYRLVAAAQDARKGGQR